MFIGSLKYAQVSKHRENGRVVEVLQRIAFGDQEDVMDSLGLYPGGRISIAYIERLNLTIRNSFARFVRRGMNWSKDLQIHSRAIDFIEAWYNFIKPYKSLRIEINQGKKDGNNELQLWLKV